MPELPEVETIRAKLAPGLTGRRFERVLIADPRLTRPEPPEEVASALEGERVVTVGRRGKYLVVEFESGRHLLIHLRMTGNVEHPARGGIEADPYRRAVVRLDDGSDVAYRDVRRFGTPVKAALLDQRAAAGIGNIYADEALWRARVHPQRPAGTLTADEISRLRKGIRGALEMGIARQGASLRDYRDPDGRRGRMQDDFRVYGRTGEPCFRCGTPIEKTRVGGRGTWYCPLCQPLDPS